MTRKLIQIKINKLIIERLIYVERMNSQTIEHTEIKIQFILFTIELGISFLR